MKKTALILTAALVACVAIARPRIEKSSMVLSDVGATATGATNTIDSVRGYVDEIDVWVTDGVSTGIHTITVSPSASTADTVAEWNLATNSVVDSAVWRPRFDGTAVDSATVLTTDPPARRLLFDDTITWTLTGSPTNKTWWLHIKYDDGR